MFKLKALVCILALILINSPAVSQQLNIATGAKDLTYSRMFNQLAAMCGQRVSLVEMNSTGSLENMDLLVGNKVNAAIVQTDVIYLRAKTDNLGHIRTLVTLHPEEVHLVTKAAGRTEGGYGVGSFRVGAKDVRLDQITDLEGRTVGAVGGSITTARVIQLLSEIRFRVVEFTNTKELIAAIGQQVDAALFVGGAPLGAIEKLSREYKLLMIDEKTAAKMAAVYSRARISYANMNSMGVPTVATDAILVTRDYKTPTYVSALSILRQCMYSNIDELRDKAGNHPKWQFVNPDNRGKWVWYDLPEATSQRRK